MATATYHLTIGRMIDTVFVLEIGGKYADEDELEGTLEKVFIANDSTRIRVELGGAEQQPWSLEVTIEADGKEFVTVPKIIKGKIGKGGGAWFDRTCPLEEA